ncbi:adaptin N terminal region-domain-containing protein [Gaertneriomyces semiglobifer]|nr:adaptin N terminal region-domain-containing protein [Gaertneriomyces semiglobifer]
MTDQVAYTVIQAEDGKDVPTLTDLRKQLENPKDDQKIDAMKKILSQMLNGDPMPQLLMHVIRFVMPSKNKQLKKLLLIYWEVCPKVGSDGKLKQEMVLVCNNLRNDLLHPNEFIRGSTLRFLTKLHEPELLEPLVPSVRQCLDHRHAYVRKNAVLAIFNIYKNLDYLLPDAPELIYNFMLQESDPNAKRNAFVMLMNTKQELAIQYFRENYGQVSSWDELLQLSVIELIRKDCRNPGADKAQYISTVLQLLESPSHSVKYEAASALITLTSHTKAIRAAASAYLTLALKEADNNVKLIVLNRVEELRSKHAKILEDLVIDVLRVTSSPDLDVRKKCLSLCTEMCSARNVEQVVLFLGRELKRTQEVGSGFEKSGEYRQLLISTLHTVAIKHPSIAPQAVNSLMEFVAESVDVLDFVKEVLEKFSELREDIVMKLLETFNEAKASRVLRGALWILGEYSEGPIINHAWRIIRENLGPVPIVEEEERLESAAAEPVESEQAPVVKSAIGTGRRVLADGTYASESAFGASKISSASTIKARPVLRDLIIKGDYFLASVLSTTISKLVLRQIKSQPNETEPNNSLKAEGMLILTSIVRLGKSRFSAQPIDEDSEQRIMANLRLLSSHDSSVETVLLEESRKVISQKVSKGMKLGARYGSAAQPTEERREIKQVDEGLNIRWLKKKGVIDDDVNDLAVAAVGDDSSLVGSKARGKLSKVVQLTGYSDTVYAEAYVTVHQFDILLDILLVNQTPNTFQNLTIEFSCLGDLKIVEKPGTYTLAPHGFLSVKTGVKISSTETGVVFGNITYDVVGKGHGDEGDSGVVVLKDIHVDIGDYVRGGWCEEVKFRMMWSEFEWENKVNVNTNITDLHTYLNHILKATNMSCLTPPTALEGECGFLAANLYARSVFGEDALANVCLELVPNPDAENGEDGKPKGTIQGHIRIRSKTQGIALSLGDKVTLCQKVGR